MSAWQEVALGDVAAVSWGDTSVTKRSYASDGWPAYSASGPDGLLPYFDHDQDGVVVSAIGAKCGKTWLAQGKWSAIKNTLWFRAQPDVADTTFLYYATANPSYWPRRGAAQPFISLGEARLTRLRLPSLATQRAIAATLRSLDDLIENNRRRIVLLEQMARAIYREWFVNFRYPGHEDDELVDSPLGSIPSGWEVVRLENALELRYGKSLKADARAGGSVAVVGSSGVVGWHNQPLVSGPAIVVGRKGNVGSVTWVTGDVWPIDTTYYVVTDLPLHYVYRLLHGVEFIDSHAAVPGLSRDQAYTLEVVQPPFPLLGRFDAVAAELMAMTVALDRQADVLTLTRDVLLPRLVTGSIDVSHLDLDALLEQPAA
jgi:type I restriction enzyme, S subunit